MTTADLNYYSQVHQAANKTLREYCEKNSESYNEVNEYISESVDEFNTMLPTEFLTNRINYINNNFK